MLSESPIAEHATIASSERILNEKALSARRLILNRRKRLWGTGSVFDGICLAAQFFVFRSCGTVTVAIR